MAGMWHCQGMGSTPLTGRGTAVPARQQSIREANLALVFRHVIDAPTPISRAAISAATGMTRATASALADALIAAGLVDEVDPPSIATAGRPAAGLVPALLGPAGLGLEVNVDYLAACVVDLSGEVRHHTHVRVDLRGQTPSGVLSQVADLAARAVEAVPELVVAGAALAMPGLIDRQTGAVLRAPNLGWQGTAVPALLGPLLAPARFPLMVGNEADFAALGELQADTTGELEDFLYVSADVGIGAGIVLGRELFTGARGWAGEIGHLTVEPDGERCRCGARGCLETVAGTDAIARDGVDRAAAGLGRAVAAAVNILDIPVVVLGGTYADPAHSATFSAAVQRALAEHVISAGWSPVQVRPSRLGGGDPATRGAAMAVVQRVHADPAVWVASR
jgi:predicted NBD/HSP70 family sugar kinase